MKELFLLLFISLSPWSDNDTIGLIDEDTKWLALNVYYESRSEPWESQLAVSYVVLNRVSCPKYPSSIKDVITQNKQFSWYNNDKNIEPTDMNSWQQALFIARLSIKTYTPYNSLEGAKHYHANYVNPYWSDSKELVATYGSHKFYK